MRYFTLFVVLMFAALMLMAPSSAVADSTWTTKGEWLHLPAGEETAIPLSRLVGNDDGAPSGVITIQLLGGPPELTVSTTQDQLILHAERLTAGEYPFHYELQSASGDSGVVRSVISLVPKVQPMAGNWSFLFAQGAGGEESTGECSLGDGAELGFYQGPTGTFTLCDFYGVGPLKDCVHWQTPEAAQGLHPDGDFRLAMAADWDGDGVDEPALYDPESGELQTYEYTNFCSQGSCLVAGQQISLKDTQDVLPLVGHWRSGALEFASYDLLAGELTGPDDQVIDFQPAGLEARPVAGAWVGGALDTLGIWDHLAHQLHFLTDSNGSGGTISGVGVVRSREVFVFTGRWSDCGGEGDFLGLYEPAQDRVALLPAPADDYLRGLHVKVVVDPGGGGD